jgi:PHD/YefM family antitoxin component YafN of YafNO toxin-antitoxin module
MSIYSRELTTPELQTQLSKQSEQHAAELFAQLLEAHRYIDVVSQRAEVVALHSRQDWHNETARLQEEAGQIPRSA